MGFLAFGQLSPILSHPLNSDNLRRICNNPSEQVSRSDSLVFPGVFNGLSRMTRGALTVSK